MGRAQGLSVWGRSGGSSYVEVCQAWPSQPRLRTKGLRVGTKWGLFLAPVLNPVQGCVERCCGASGLSGLGRRRARRRRKPFHPRPFPTEGGRAGEIRPSAPRADVLRQLRTLAARCGLWLGLELAVPVCFRGGARVGGKTAWTLAHEPSRAFDEAEGPWPCRTRAPGQRPSEHDLRGPREGEEKLSLGQVRCAFFPMPRPPPVGLVGLPSSDCPAAQRLSRLHHRHQHPPERHHRCPGRPWWPAGSAPP